MQRKHMSYIRTMMITMVLMIVSMVGLPQSAKAATIVLPESNDFATQVLQDPWDMNEFSDVSQHINGDGQFNQLTNISVADGVFSARSTDDNYNASLFLLFPGFKDTISAGKVGDLYPIDSARFKCLYAAMFIDSYPVDKSQPDSYYVYWFATKNRNNDPKTLWGGSAKAVKDDANQTPYWNLYKMDLSTATPAGGTAAWNSQAKWIGLRLDPTTQKNTDFQLDWARLTDCTPVNMQVNWGSTGTKSLWARPVGTNRYIRIAKGLSGTGGTIDFAGLAPGSYDIFRGDSDTTWTTSLVTSIEINRSPTLTITRPSFTSGAAYINPNSHSWEMSAPSDVNSVQCVSNYQFSGGSLVLNTPSGACASGGVADPKIYLQSPSQISTSYFRYLTYRIYTQGDMQKFGKGWLVRWIWDSNGCTMVSRDIPYDTGWHIYSVDLLDGYAGLSVQQVGSCPGGTLSWQSPSTANSFRFDPNENITGTNLHQEIDWITLNAMDKVVKGTNFPILFVPQKPGTNIQYTAYYTTNRANPTQSKAQIAVNTSQPPQARGPNAVFLPLVANGIAQGQIMLNWVTNNVNPGQYYICIQADDGLNSAISCSEAPVAVQ